MNCTEKLAALIPYGRENAISRESLAAALGVSDRKTRRAIEQARADGLIIINSQDGRGYFQTDSITEMRRQYQQDTARALAIFRRRKPLRKALLDAGMKLKG